eukprot:3573392-Pyramimonas_sp.AAC.1
MKWPCMEDVARRRTEHMHLTDIGTPRQLQSVMQSRARPRHHLDAVLKCKEIVTQRNAASVKEQVSKQLQCNTMHSSAHPGTSEQYEGTR